jgi:hypothetical protein
MESDRVTDGITQEQTREIARGVRTYVERATGHRESLRDG